MVDMQTESDSEEDDARIEHNNHNRLFGQTQQRLRQTIDMQSKSDSEEEGDDKRGHSEARVLNHVIGSNEANAQMGTKEELSNLTVVVLKQRLRELGLHVTGRKADLVGRLTSQKDTVEEIERLVILTHHDILHFGLVHVGFGDERQNVREKLTVDRFKSFFGSEPRTVKDVLLDLKEEFPNIVFKEVMMSMNWLKLCKFFRHLCIYLINTIG